MKIAPPPGPNHADWKTLYRAAILETNTTGIPKLVSEAEKAVISRKRELFGTMGTFAEKEALDDALYALHTRKTACEHIERGITSSGKTLTA